MLAGEDISILVISDGETNFTLENVCVDGRGVRRTWVTRRTRSELDAFSDALVEDLGYAAVPPLPPPGAAAADVERWLATLLQAPKTTGPDLFAFIDAPPDVAEQPVLVAEVVGDDEFAARSAGRRWRSAADGDYESGSGGRSSRRRNGGDASTSRSGAVGGAVVGGILLGPLGAAIGAVVGSAVAERDDAVGSAVVAAGGAAEAAAAAAVDRARRIDKTYDVRKRAKTAASVAVKGAQRVDQEFGITRRLGKAVRGVGDALRKAADDVKEKERGRK